MNSQFSRSILNQNYFHKIIFGKLTLGALLLLPVYSQNYKKSFNFHIQDNSSHTAFFKKIFKNAFMFVPKIRQLWTRHTTFPCRKVFHDLYFLVALFVSLRVVLFFVLSVAASPLDDLSLDDASFDVAESFVRVLLDDESATGEESWK